MYLNFVIHKSTSVAKNKNSTKIRFKDDEGAEPHMCALLIEWNWPKKRQQEKNKKKVTCGTCDPQVN